MTCRRMGRETITFGLNETPHPPRVCHEAVGKVNIQAGLCVGSSGLVIPFSISEANMINLMNMMDRWEGKRISDTGIINMEAMMREDDKQGGQQEDDGWVMVQRVRGRDVVDDNGGGCVGSEQVATSTGEINERAIETLRTGDTLYTCCLFQTQPFQPGVLSSSLHGLVIIFGG